MVPNFLKELFNKKGFLKVTIPAPSEALSTPMKINEDLTSKYGVAWQVFLPETLRVCLKRDFNISLNEVLMNKVLATQTVLLNPYFSWDIFEKVCISFNNRIPDFMIIEPLSTLEMTWGYVCMKSLRPDYQITDEVKKYAEVVMKDSGLIWNPWMNISVGVDGDIRETWKSVDKVPPNDSVGVQIDRLSIIQEYVREMA
jgi:hypothetical protein